MSTIENNNFKNLKNKYGALFVEEVSGTEEYNDCVAIDNAAITKNIPFFDELTLCNFLGIDTPVLNYIKVNGCNKDYKTYYIDKMSKKLVPRNFPGKLREINAPSATLKNIQRKLSTLLRYFPAHPANYGFIAGKGIKDAVDAVRDGETLIHVDIEKFFNNHSALFVKEKFKEKFYAVFGYELPNDLLNIITNIFCKNNRLPQGSPASPLLVVVLNEEMDKKLAEIAEKYNMIELHT